MAGPPLWRTTRQLLKAFDVSQRHNIIPADAFGVTINIMEHHHRVLKHEREVWTANYQRDTANHMQSQWNEGVFLDLRPDVFACHLAFP
jgi:hypothetical protein